MFRRILIANRGEIALRIMRACHQMGIEAVAVCSEADKGARYLSMAHDTICIGPARSAQSYLDISRIVSAAEIADVDAIHPGYGFLSEKAHFAEVCRSCGITFIGPPPEAINLMGDKSKAKDTARKAGVPTIPGSDGPVGSEQEALAIAKQLGYPIMIKAVSGGGGRGMRVAHNDVSLVSGYHAARSEAEAAFGDSSVYLEKMIQKARHIEVQFIADQHGNVFSLGERDCTTQRRHQKLIEEAPSPVVTPELRQQMGDAARALCKQAGYYNAGTIEFLLDADNRFYFMEVNARIQVEHPVTEEVTGIDLIEAQLRVAAGERLPWKQEEIQLRGHAIECRINAEDPAQGFKPSPGVITTWIAPGGRNVRLDTHAHAGYRIPSHYDSMIGKLIVRGETREEAIAILLRALDEFVVEGVKTTIPLHKEILRSEAFRKAQMDTKYVETHLLP
ncbi:MAG: acetyl-CoA carboxylase biotin carboxylase subunit [Planctomycetes bacterium]|nr:acetyl-CoA carboxylase biotin carboxylase subunit [Planctomycetota bacterium]